MVDYTKIKKKIPADVHPHLVTAMERFNIDSVLRVSHFISQVSHESGNFKFVVENLNYGAHRLLEVFPKYFPTLAIATQYARQPEKIASRTYANRYGNGAEATKDGYTFRGRGYIQLTFKNNYKAFGDAIGEDLVLQPDLVATPKYASLSACWFFSANGLNAIADKGSSGDIVTQITKRINGGTHGLDARKKLFNEYFALLSTTPAVHGFGYPRGGDIPTGNI